MTTPSKGQKYRTRGVPYVDSHRVEVDEVVVLYFPRGGGAQHRLPLREFLDRYQPEEENEWRDTFPMPAVFDFDDGPSFVGFTYGDRWNGWGNPHCEVNVFRTWLEAFEKQWGEGTTLFRFLDDEDGSLVYDDSEYYGEEDDYTPEIYFPTELKWHDKTYQVYALGGSLTWNEYALCPDTLEGIEENGKKLIPMPGVELPTRETDEH